MRERGFGAGRRGAAKARKDSDAKRRKVMSDAVLERLAATIRARRDASADKSYTRQLLQAGPEGCARKLGEEAIETVIAGVGQDSAALKAEAADLIYHLMVLLESRGVALEEVLQLLESRMGVSGLKEKASRAGSGD
jgi:phosphoribosyl-ATP pyrophosphohydrolase